jgi:hypothetical protein
MEKIEIVCTNNEKTKTADVLSMTDKHLKVALEGTMITIDLVRNDLNKPYVGNKSGLEFTWLPKN